MPGPVRLDKRATGEEEERHVTEELRTLMRSELSAERPPPLGDMVGAAMRDGRRIRRVRRFGVAGAGAAVLGVIALTATLLPGLGSSAAPVQPTGAGPGAVVEPAVPPSAVPVTPLPSSPGAADLVRPFVSAPPPVKLREDGTPFGVPVVRRPAEGKQKAVTPGAMLELLTELLPDGKTSHYAVAGDQDTHVQLYLTTAKGTGMIRASLEKDFTGRPVAPGLASVTVDHLPDNCVQSIVVDAALPNGANLALNIASCLSGAPGRPTPQAITVEHAVTIVTDPRWGLTMDARLVDLGGKRFADLPKMR
jgi:hypothetical protein